jgi:hypothetical protein
MLSSLLPRAASKRAFTVVDGEKSMKMRVAFEGVGAALLLFPYYLPFFHPQNHDIYFHGLPVANLVGGLLVNLLGCAILVTGLLAAVQYLAPRARWVLEAIFAGIMLWSMGELAFHVLIDMLYPITYWGHIWERSALAIPTLLGVLACFIPRVSRPVVRATRLALAALALSALWIVPHLMHIALAQPRLQTPATNALAAPAMGTADRRIIWILFDELSYDQTFDHRDADIHLPNFDKLRAGSVSFSNLKPIGYETNRIIPSLFIGNSFKNFRSTVDGRLSFWDESQHHWMEYDSSSTLFGLAQRNGWKTGADGWFNPYCGILAPYLDACYRDVGAFLPTEEYGASEDKSIWANAAAVPNQFLAALISAKESPASEHIQTYWAVMVHTHALIDDPQLRFIFLHLPVPHPPGIYDRQRHVVRAGGNYLDNLVLADDTLGTLMQQINATPSASQTTVIVTSDHSWRIPLWKPADGWSEEEQRVSGGRFDTRPVLLVHFPEQSSGQDVQSPTTEMIEHDLMAEMLCGRIHTREELNAFVSKYGR